jgi:hypothetical protein
LKKAEGRGHKEAEGRGQRAFMRRKDEGESYKVV